MKPLTSTQRVAAPWVTIETYRSIQVTGIGVCMPPRSVTQAELLEQLGLTGDRFASTIASQSGIETRQFFETFPEVVRHADPDYAADYHRRHAPALALGALRAAAGDMDLESFDGVVVATSTGYMLPGIAEVLAQTHGVGRRDAHRFNIVGHGCIAGLTGIEVARGLIVSEQAQRVAVICTEPQAAISPLSRDRMEVVQNLLFGEGAAALVFDAAGTGGAGLPSFVDSEQELAPDSIDSVQVRQGRHWDGTLDRKVPSIAASVLPRVVDRLLRRHRLTIPEVRHWAIHAGGRKVLDVCQQGLGLSDEQMAPSRTVLRRHGNVSSGTVFLSLDTLLKTHKPSPGDVGVMIAFGPGLVVGAFLMRW